MKKTLYTPLLVCLPAYFSYLFLDKEIAQFFRYSPLQLQDLFQIITQAGDSKYSLVISFLLFIFFRFRHNRLFESRAIFVWLSIATSGIIADIIKPLAGRARPRMLFENGVYGFDFMKFGHIFNSFPSGHSTTAMSFALSLAFLFPKYKKYLLLFGVIVAFSRVVINAHYFSDVLIGGLIGVLTVFVLERYFANQKCYNIYQNGCKL